MVERAEGTTGPSRPRCSGGWAPPARKPSDSWHARSPRASTLEGAVTPALDSLAREVCRHGTKVPATVRATSHSSVGHGGPVSGGGLRRLRRDPLGHFLLLGALLFAAYALLGGGRSRTDAANPVVIGAGEVRWLTETWSRQWRREPTQEELRDLVNGLVREELLARAARDMRLDEDDVIVRRRLAQKLEFVLRDTAADGEPTDAELEGLLAEHPERFRVEARRSFSQVLFSASRADPRADAAHALRQLTASRSPAAKRWGDPQLLPESLRDADEQSVVAAFGPAFARE